MENIAARFKVQSEDFIVEEIGPDWQCTISKEDNFNTEPDLATLDLNQTNEFLLCELEKKDIDHFSARKVLASALHKGSDAIGFAGIKDKKAHTSQRISIFQPDLEKIKQFKHPHIYLKNGKWGKRKIKLGYLIGNKFTVTLREIEKKEAIKVANQIRKDSHFANYFGKQRFGSVRGNNAELGKLLVKKKFREFVWKLLTETSNNEQEEVTLARERLAQEKNFKEALDYFPEYLRFERSILSFILESDEDWIKVIRRCERKSILLYIHALQSKLFNQILEEALVEDIDFTKKGQMRIPLFGYKSKIDEGKLGEIESTILEYNNIQIEDFKIPELSYLSVKGDFRMALIQVKNIDVQIEDDELYSNAKKIILSFELPSGVYATTFLENFFDLIEERDTKRQ